MHTTNINMKGYFKATQALLLLAMLALPLLIRAQSRPIYSQYIFNQLVINPAYAGNQKQFMASALFRDQWVNIEGAPSVQTFAAHTALPKRPVGVGMLVTHDQIGIHSDVGAYFSYSYQIQMKNGAQLAMGLQGGVNFITSDFNKLDLRDVGDPSLSGVTQSWNPNFGVGLFYSTPTMYIGVSVPYLLNNEIYDGTDVINQATQARNYYIAAGKILPLGQSPYWVIRPSVLVRVEEGSALGVDVNGTLIYRGAVFLGASYRSGDAVVGLFELQVNDNFRFGYAYDFVTSNLGPYTNGSHEIMVNYRVNVTRTKCQTYF